MPSTYTTNKSIEKPALNSYVDTWDQPVNDDWDIIDAAFGATTYFNVTAQSGTIVLTDADYQPAFLDFSGVLTANVTYEIPNNVGGQWTARNTTTGAYALTISCAGGGTSVALDAGNSIIFCDGTNVRLSTPRANGDGFLWENISANTTGAAGYGYIIDTTSGVVTLTLPASPAAGDYIGVIDALGTFATNNLTVARNGNLIQGAAANLTCDINGQTFALVYQGATGGWRVSNP
jgi:hypothetical protein